MGAALHKRAILDSLSSKQYRWACMADDLPILHVYMDESGQTANRYMCVSAVIIRRERIDEVRAEINRIKLAGEIASEAKWTKVTSHRLRTYKVLVGYFFDLVRAGHIHFHALICDFREFDHWKNGGREGSVSRMLFQLALHKGCYRYGAGADLHLFPDSGDHAVMMSEHRYHLNNSARSKMPGGRQSAERPVVHIEPTNSANEPLLQLNDLILGAICYRRNERYDAPNASPHKKALARLVAKHAGATTFHYNPSTFGKRFSVWNFKDPTKLKLGRKGRSPRP